MSNQALVGCLLRVDGLDSALLRSRELGRANQQMPKTMPHHAQYVEPRSYALHMRGSLCVTL